MANDNNRIQNLLDFINTTSSNSYWYPLAKLTREIPVISYNIGQIYDNDQIATLQSVVQQCKIDRVIMIQIDHQLLFDNENILDLLYELDNDGYVFPWYSETYFFDNSKKWMIYLSHERTITFAGDELVEFAREILPAEYLY